MPYTQCRACGREEDWEDYDDAREEGWFVAEEDGDDLCPEHAGRCSGCGTPIDSDSENIEWIDDDAYCDSCSSRQTLRCSECDELINRRNVFYLVNQVTHEVEYRCRNCIGDYRNGDQYGNRGYLTEVKLMNSNGHVFQLDLNPKFKRWCPSCEGEYEPCADCLKRAAEERLKEETTLWVYDTHAKQYHDCDHEKFKRLKYREEHEHPFLYYGMELELLFASREQIDNITRDFITATNGMFVAEFDRSISNLGNGIEFISRPMSYKKWTSEETLQLLKAGFAAIAKYNPMTPQPDGCGIHIHMSRIFFERNTTKDIQQIRSDLDWIFQVFQPEIEKLSERKYTIYCASKAFKVKNQLQGSPATRMLKGKFNLTREIQCSESDLQNSDHHDCVTMTPKTIEIRTFKSTVSPKHLITIIEMCRGLAHAARNMELTEETTLSSILFAKDSNYLPDFVRKAKVDTSKKFNTNIEVEL